MATQEIRLSDETGTVSKAKLTALAAALQTQVTRDLGPAWGVQANVSVGKAVAGTWGMRIVEPDELPQGAGGVHLDDNGVPFAIVGPGSHMTIAASHELCEMLVDPFGQKLVAAPSLDPDSGGRTVFYLVEVGDPCEVFGYDIDGITVSDFVLQEYYRPQAADQVDDLGELSGPFVVPTGCYISWYDPADSRWHQVRPDGSFVTAPEATKLSDRPRQQRDEALGDDDDQHNLGELFSSYKPVVARD